MRLLNKSAYFIFLFFIVCCQLSSYAQHNQKLDSLLMVYKTQPDSKEKIQTVSALFNAVIYTTPEEGFKYANELIALSKKFNNLRGMGMGYYHLSVYYTIKNESENVISNLNEAQKAFTQTKSKKDLALVYSSMAMHYFDQGIYDRALNLTDSVIDIFDNMGDSYRTAVMRGVKAEIYSEKGNYLLAYHEAQKSYQVIDTLNKPIRKALALAILANVETKLGYYQVALEHNLEIIPIYKKYSDSLALPVVYNDIGTNYIELNEYEQASDYLTKSLQLARKYNMTLAEGNALLNLAVIDRKQNQSQQALIKLNDALRIFNEIDYKKEIAQVKNEMGLVYSKLRQLDKAMEAYNESVALFQSIGSKDNLKEVLKNRAYLFEEKGMYKQAFKEYQLYHSLSDSVLNIEKSRQIEDLRTIHETEQKEQQILKQKNEIVLLKQNAKINNLKATLAVVGFVMAVLLILGILVFYKQRVKQNILEKEKIITELEFKRKELTANALHLAGKNELLETLKEQVKSIKQNNALEINDLINTINFNIRDDNNWENFRKRFESVHKDFYTNMLKEFPQLTANELRLIALLKMNLTSKEIANILNISIEGIKKARYRLRKKLEISNEESLQDKILSM